MPAAPDVFDIQAAREVSSRTWLTDQQRQREAAARASDLREADRLARADAERAQATAEVAAERARIAAVATAGRDYGRTRQAVRLALLADLDAAGARSILSALPPDRAAAADALIIPDHAPAFGSPAAQGERRRIAAILTSAEAESRFHAALAIALDTTTSAEAAVTLLAALPIPVPEQTIEERQKAAGDFGHLPGGGHQSADDRAAEIWRKATSSAASSHPGAVSDMSVGAAKMGSQ